MPSTREWDIELSRTASPFRQLLTKSILIFYGETGADRTTLVADIYYRHVSRVYDQVVVILEGGMAAIDELDETVHESISEYSPGGFCAAGVVG